MTTITIPKNLIKNDELVVIPRKEYEEFSQWKDIIKSFKVFTPTKKQKTELERARKDYKEKKYLTLNELKRKLGIKN